LGFFPTIVGSLKCGPPKKRKKRIRLGTVDKKKICSPAVLFVKKGNSNLDQNKKKRTPKDTKKKAQNLWPMPQKNGGVFFPGGGPPGGAHDVKKRKLNVGRGT